MDEENKETVETGTANAQEQDQIEGAEKTYTDAQVRELLQREGDRRVTQALAKQKQEYDKKLSLAALDKEKRADAEKDIAIRELEEQIAGYKHEKAQAELRAVLSARGLPAELADNISVGDDAQVAQKAVDALDKAFKSAVQDEVKRRITSAAPKTGVGEPSSMTREQFGKLTLAQQADLYAKNPELYRQLTK